jgi:hypothetical protein
LLRLTPAQVLARHVVRHGREALRQSRGRRRRRQRGRDLDGRRADPLRLAGVHDRVGVPEVLGAVDVGRGALAVAGAGSRSRFAG